MKIILNMLITAYLLVYCLMDLRTGRLWWPLSIPVEALGIFLLAAGGQARLSQVLAGAFPGILILPFSLMPGRLIGSGDVLTVVVCGSLLGFTEIYERMFLASLLAAASAFIRMRGGSGTFPFIPFLFAAHIVYQVPELLRLGDLLRAQI